MNSLKRPHVENYAGRTLCSKPYAAEPNTCTVESRTCTIKSKTCATELSMECVPARMLNAHHCTFLQMCMLSVCFCSIFHVKIMGTLSPFHRF